MSQRPESEEPIHPNVPGGDGNGEGPPPITTCPPCQSFADDYNSTQSDIADLQSQLAGASDSEKSGLLKMISDDRRQLAVQLKALRECEAQNCPPTPTPQTLVGTLIATSVVIWTDNPQLPFAAPNATISMTLSFERTSGMRWAITQLVLDPFSLPGGRITLKQFVNGSFDASPVPDPAAGTMDLDLVLRVHIDDPFEGQDSDIEFLFNTGMNPVAFTLPSGDTFLTGTPFDTRTQQIQLVAAGQFSGGYLDQNHAAISLGGADTSNWPQN